MIFKLVGVPFARNINAPFECNCHRVYNTLCHIVGQVIAKNILTFVAKKATFMLSVISECIHTVCYPRLACVSSPLIAVLCWAQFSTVWLIHTAIYFEPCHVVPGLEGRQTSISHNSNFSSTVCKLHIIITSYRHVDIAVKWCEWAYGPPHHRSNTFTISSDVDHNRLVYY